MSPTGPESVQHIFRLGRTPAKRAAARTAADPRAPRHAGVRHDVALEISLPVLYHGTVSCARVRLEHPVDNNIVGILRRMQPRYQRYRGGLQVASVLGVVRLGVGEQQGDGLRAAGGGGVEKNRRPDGATFRVP